MQTSSPRTMGHTEWALLVSLSILWGGSFLFGKIALAELRPFTVVLLRVGIAALALNLVVLASGRRMPRSSRTWGAFLVMGLLNNIVPFSLIFWGQTHIQSSLAAILNATTPVWTVLLAHALTRDERLAPHKAAGVLAGLAGAVVVIGPGALLGLGIHAMAQLAVVAAAVSYALAGVYGKRFAGLPPVTVAAGQLSASAVVTIPLALLADRPWLGPLPGPGTWGAVLCLALLSTALAYVIYFRLLAKAGATNVLHVTFLIPVSALILGALVLGESLDLRQAAGMALVILGLAAIDGRPLRRVGCLWGRRAARRATSEDYSI
ncbi:putative cystine transporter YijE [anaerobic digester metagenome]